MGIGAVNQPLYIRNLPPGVVMTITNVDLIIPSDNPASWWPTFSGNKKVISKNSSDDNKKEMFPYTVSPDRDEGKIGEVGLTTLSMFDSGDGPSARIEFTFTGAVPINGQQCPVDQKGEITVSTTQWGTLWGIFKLKPYSRPDQTIISYKLADSPIGTKSNNNDALQSPRGIEITTIVEVNSAQFGLRADVMSDSWKTAIDWTLKGIFWGHEAAVGWVTGKVGLTAGAVAAAAWEAVRNA